MTDDRPKTPPQASNAQGTGGSRIPLTPEQVKKIEINRLKAKALRDQREAEAQRQASTYGPRQSGNLAAGQKRGHDAASRNQMPATSRDARNPDAPKPAGFRPLDEIQPARNFTKYVEYDFSKMTDTKGGFLTSDDDPFNKALKVSGAEDKPAHMTLKEWERLQLLKKLREQKSGPFQPSMLEQKSEVTKVCRECSSLEIDYKWDEIFGYAICNVCKEKFPEKYSLLTKTEAKEDYLLTDPELKDEELLPHLEKPNPHKSNWHNMMLFLRCQVEDYAFSDKKWGSPEGLDEAFEKREAEKKKRKQDKFKSKLQDLKKRTRVEAYKRSRQAGSGGDFGDDMGKGGKHTHVWGRPVENEDGMSVKTCAECGMEVEELEF
jgi:DNA-repair protein complementing XP-A cells